MNRKGFFAPCPLWGEYYNYTMEQAIVGLILFIFGGVNVVRPDLMVRFQIWSQRTIMGAEYIPSKRTYVAIRILGAVLIDEIVRMSPFEEAWDKFLLKLLGRNVSVGVAQVKLETANGLIKGGLYNPNPDDAKLPFSGNLRQTDREHLYGYVVQPKHNIRFVAARIRDLIKGWSKYIDISGMPEILGTLYHRSYVSPHAHPIPNKRGSQIAEEFYALATKWLRS